MQIQITASGTCKKSLWFVNDCELLSPWTAKQILVVNYRPLEHHNESFWRLCLVSCSHKAMLFACQQAIILSIIRIKVDRDINIGRARWAATGKLNEKHDSDNCLFYHSASVTCFDVLNHILPFIVVLVWLCSQHVQMREM